MSGDGGSRTPVRKPHRAAFFERRSVFMISLPLTPLTRLKDPVASYAKPARSPSGFVPYINDAGCSGRRHLSPTRRIKRRELHDWCQFLFAPVLSWSESTARLQHSVCSRRNQIHPHENVRLAGLEPARRSRQGILSPWCLPIPPQPRLPSGLADMYILSQYICYCLHNFARFA